MKREWKFGDVANVRNEHGVWNVAICTLRGDHDGMWWRFGVADSWLPVAGSEARYLLPIELPAGAFAGWPVLVDAFKMARAKTGLDLVFDGLIDQIEVKALSRPPEPTGLGAVAEDAYGRKWLRVSDGLGWINHSRQRDPSVKWAAWSDIAAVRVLSEGVQ